MKAKVIRMRIMKSLKTLVQKLKEVYGKNQERCIKKTKIKMGKIKKDMKGISSIKSLVLLKSRKNFSIETEEDKSKAIAILK